MARLKFKPSDEEERRLLLALLQKLRRERPEVLPAILALVRSLAK